MYIKNKLGIYVYSNNRFIINNIPFYVNSISYIGKFKYRFIDNKTFGIEIRKFKHNVYKK